MKVRDAIEILEKQKREIGCYLADNLDSIRRYQERIEECNKLAEEQRRKILALDEAIEVLENG